MNKLEKRKLEHELRNRLVNISALCKRIKKEIKECEKVLDSIPVDGLTGKDNSGRIE